MKIFVLALLLPCIAFAQNKPKSELFASPTPLHLELHGAFQRVKAANGEGNWKDDDRSSPKFWSEMRLVDLATPERVFLGKLRARGMSSGLEGEGDFPKLKIEIDKSQDRENSPFASDREFRLNTHVSTYPETERTEMGRLNDERAPYREALVYEIAEILGFPTVAYRRAVIDYFDTETNEAFQRQALVLEKDKSAAKRYGAKVISIADFAASQRTGISAYEGAYYHLFEALIGNKDFILRTDREPRREDNPIWGCGNCLVMERPDGTRLIGPYDFDLATIVAGEEKIQGHWRTYPELGFPDEASSFLAWSLVSLKSRFEQNEVEKALAAIRTKAPEIREQIMRASVDLEGRQVALRHLDRFLTLTDAALALPVIAAPGIYFTSDEQGQLSKLHTLPSGKAAPLRPGTPVKVLERSGTALKVAIFDFRWDLKEGEPNVGYIPLSAPLAQWVPNELLSYHDERDIPEPDSRR